MHLYFPFFRVKMNGEWISKLVTMRRAQQSNVFLVQTTDIRRFNESMKNIAFPHKKIEQVLIYRPYINTLSEIDLDDKAQIVETDMDIPIEGPYMGITKALKSKTTLLLIEGVLVQAHADIIRDWLISWSHEATITTKQSTVLVFTSSFNFFAEPLRRRSVEIEPPISLPMEREDLMVKNREELLKGLKVKGVQTALSDDEYFKRILPSLVLASSGLTLHETATATQLSFLEHKDYKVEVFSQMRTRILASMGLTLEEPRSTFFGIKCVDRFRECWRIRLP